MAKEISFDGLNHGIQMRENNGHVTAHFHQSQTQLEQPLDQACLRDLQTTNPHFDRERIESKSGGLLKDSYCWILENEEFNQWNTNGARRLLWIKGDPGKGKTMLMCGIIKELQLAVEETADIVFFFCQATDARLNNASAVLRGLIYMIIRNKPAFISHVRKHWDPVGKSLFDDHNKWEALSKIFLDILSDPTLRETFFIIDALDECVTDLPLLLHFVVKNSSIHPHTKWIVSSRNWLEIEERLKDSAETALISLELNDTSVSEAVGKFIKHKVNKLADDKKYNHKTRDKISGYLLSNSQGTFLWVALVCQELDRTLRRHALQKLNQFPPGLDALYDRMMTYIQESPDAGLCKRILAIVSVVYRPITLHELGALLDMPYSISDDDDDDGENLAEIIALCGSFLTLREDTISFVHQSAQDFLKSLKEVFPTGIETQHHEMHTKSLGLMLTTLKRDIYNLGARALGLHVRQIQKPNPDPLAAIKYASLYWVEHLEDSGFSQDADPYVEKGIETFLQEKYLQWLEAVSILGNISQGITAILKLEGILQKHGKSHPIWDRARDACRFFQYFKEVLEINPLQIYSSSLIFSPMASITRICFQDQEPYWVLNRPKVEHNWSQCLQTLEVNSGLISAVVCTRDGDRLISGSTQDDTVRVWDAVTGQCTLILHGYIESKLSFSLSPDQSLVAFGSKDLTVKIWDLATGLCVLSLQGHSFVVHSVAWSHDGNRLASTSVYDDTIMVWDPATGQCVSKLKAPVPPVHSIAWSRDSSRLASDSGDKTVRIWNAESGECISILEGHDNPVYWIAWSQDKGRLATAFEFTKVIRIWDTDTGQCLHTLDGHSGEVSSLTWSQDGGRIASASVDSDVRVWNPVTGKCVSVLKGHKSGISSIIFSQNSDRIASGSHDGTIKIWDSATGQCLLTLAGHSRGVTSVAWMPNESRLASASVDKTIKIWDLAPEPATLSFDRHSEFIDLLIWSQDGRQLASASEDGIIKIWDSDTGQCISTLQGHRGHMHFFGWSQDGSRIASASHVDSTIRTWNPVTGQCLLTLEGYDFGSPIPTWSPDGSRLALKSSHKTPEIWDSATNQCIFDLLEDGVRSIAWSYDGGRIALGVEERPHTVSIWDLVTGQRTMTLAITEQAESILLISWSQDGSRLVTESQDHTTFRVWDLTTGQCVSLQGHTDFINSVAWSQDGSQLFSASLDDTVKIWDLFSNQCTSTLYFDKFRNPDLQKILDKSDPRFPSFVVSPSRCSGRLPKQEGYGFNDELSWITYKGNNLLWLPPDYRPVSYQHLAVFQTTIAVCCSSDRVVFLKLSKLNPLSGLS